MLIEHLDDEEGHLLPLAARHLTSPEWAALGEHFVATTPKAQLLIFLGAVLEEATPTSGPLCSAPCPWWRDSPGGAWDVAATPRTYVEFEASPAPKAARSPPKPHGGLTMSFSEPELAFLSSQTMGRLATVQPDGTLQVNPVGFTYNAELDTFDIHGYRLSTSRKFRNVAANGRSCVRRRRRPLDRPVARALPRDPGPRRSHHLDRADTGRTGRRGHPHPPERIISFGIVIPDQEPQAMTPHNRDVAPR